MCLSYHECRSRTNYNNALKKIPFPVEEMSNLFARTKTRGYVFAVLKKVASWRQCCVPTGQ